MTQIICDYCREPMSVTQVQLTTRRVGTQDFCDYKCALAWLTRHREEWADQQGMDINTELWNPK
jgi:hypothetical protein